MTEAVQGSATALVFPYSFHKNLKNKFWRQAQVVLVKWFDHSITDVSTHMLKTYLVCTVWHVSLSVSFLSVRWCFLIPWNGKDISLTIAASLNLKHAPSRLRGCPNNPHYVVAGFGIYSAMLCSFCLFIGQKVSVSWGKLRCWSVLSLGRAKHWKGERGRLRTHRPTWRLERGLPSPSSSHQPTRWLIMVIDILLPYLLYTVNVTGSAKQVCLYAGSGSPDLAIYKICTDIPYSIYRYAKTILCIWKRKMQQQPT